MSFAHFDEICGICCELDEEPRFIRRFEHVDGFPEGILPEDNAIYMIECRPLV